MLVGMGEECAYEAVEVATEFERSLSEDRC
jgi:hypothetical protein